MKQLHELKDVHQQKMNALLNEHNVFWAFSNAQFEEGKAANPLEPGDKYVRLPWGGGYMPKSKVDSLKTGLTELRKWYEEATKDFREENILYELYNHEAFYTGDIESTMDALGEGYTVEEVIKVYNDNKKAAYEALGW
jgi:hypothetical protein